MPLTPNLLLKTQNQRKEAGRYAASPLNFHDHLVLETAPDFMIILRLENAVVQRRQRRHGIHRRRAVGRNQAGRQWRRGATYTGDLRITTW